MDRDEREAMVEIQFLRSKLATARATGEAAREGLKLVGGQNRRLNAERKALQRRLADAEGEVERLRNAVRYLVCDPGFEGWDELAEEAEEALSAPGDTWELLGSDLADLLREPRFTLGREEARILAERLLGRARELARAGAAR